MALSPSSSPSQVSIVLVIMLSHISSPQVQVASEGSDSDLCLEHLALQGIAEKYSRVPSPELAHPSLHICL